MTSTRYPIVRYNSWNEREADGSSEKRVATNTAVAGHRRNFGIILFVIACVNFAQGDQLLGTVCLVGGVVHELLVTKWLLHAKRDVGEPPRP